MLRLFPFFVFLAVLATTNCADGPKATQEEVIFAQTTPEIAEPCKPASKHVEFQNVSFDYDPCAFGDVKAEKIPDFPLEQADMKPDGVAPEHLRFKFAKGPDGWEPFVEIYPVKRFPEMYAVNKRLSKDMEQEIRGLQRVIKDPTFRIDVQMPYLPFVDASQEFQTNVKLIRFQNGNGIFFVTYLNTELILVGNDHLRYIFEGITNDGKYILAEFPIRAPFLKDESPEEFEGYTAKFLMTDYVKRGHFAPRYRNYITSITKRLEAMNPNEFQPDLRKTEDLIASLKINN